MPTRRQFLLGSAVVAGGVAVGYRLTLPERLRPLDLQPGQSALTPYVIIDASGITLIAPRAEMGQGIHTTLAALVAEELDVTLADVRVEHGQASEHYANNIMYGPRPYADRTHGQPTQGTGAQTSIRDGFVKMRKAGAAARTVLIQAAAERLEVDPAALRTHNGTVIDAGGTALSYVELAADAARIAPPADPPLKPQSAWTVLGKSQPRVDMVAKCTGSAEYAIDVQLPGLLYATVKRNPHLGGKLLNYDDSAARTMAGVERIVPMGSGVIVIASNTWYAFRAAEHIDFEWQRAPYPDTTAEHRLRVDSEFDDRPHRMVRDIGDVDAALDTGDVIEATYRVPYLAHATMEPMNATAWLNDGRLDIWAGNQFPTRAVQIAAHLSGLQEEAIRVHTPYMGGGFGRRFEFDDVEVAVRAALAMPGRPVRVTYSREEDMTHDTYRPMAAARLRASLADGKIAALSMDLSALSLFESARFRNAQRTGERDRGAPDRDVSITMGAASQPYRVEHLRVTAYRPDKMLPVGWWRGVGESQNLYFLESFIDELAHETATDPLALRLSLLEHAPSRQVLESVAEMSDWGSPLPPGHAKGLAYGRCSGQATAEVIEIVHSARGIEILNAWAAVDVGTALDPRNIEGQVQGALNWGLCAAINGEITITDGAVDQTNYDTYPLLRLQQSPQIDVRIHESGEKIKGVGEAGVPTAAPALGNAIFAATGQRIRELPFKRHFRFI